MLRQRLVKPHLCSTRAPAVAGNLGLGVSGCSRFHVFVEQLRRRSESSLSLYLKKLP